MRKRLIYDERITQEYLLSILSYDKETGFLIRRKTGKRTDNYTSRKARIRIFGIYYSKTHIIWMMVYGKWPDSEIDHKDRNVLNDCLDNLRESDRAQNTWNRSVKRGSSSKFIGVTKHAKRWVARLWIRRKLIRIGSYESEIEAAVAYDNAARELRGEFAVTNFTT